VGSNNATIQQLQLAEISAQLSTARTAEADSRAKAELLKDALKTGRLLEISEVANNEFVRRLLSERATVRGQIALESRTLLPGHPRMKELNAQLAELDQEVRQATEKAVRALENDSRIAGSRVQTLTAAMNDRKRDSAQANEDDVQLRALEREAKSQREQLEAYMTRYREAVARESNDAIPADARIISRAIAPVTPTFPKKLPVVLVATLSTFVLALALVVTRQLMTTAQAQPLAAVPLGRVEQRVSAPPGPEPASPVAEARAPPPVQDVRLVQDLSPVQDLPPVQDPPPLPASEPAHPGLAQPPMAMPTVLTDRLAAANAPRPAAVAARSPAPPITGVMLAALAECVAGTPTAPGQGVLALCLAEDVTELALPLARLLARRLRVVLVDAQSKGDAARPGFAEAAQGSKSFFEVIQRDAGSRLHRIEPGSPAIQAMMDDRPACDVVDALRHAYDVVFVAFPPERIGSDIVGLTDIALCAGEAPDVKKEHLLALGLANAVVVSDRPEPWEAVA
jgi:polysaccharide biosynthesis transport protein